MDNQKRMKEFAEKKMDNQRRMKALIDEIGIQEALDALADAIEQETEQVYYPRDERDMYDQFVCDLQIMATDMDYLTHCKTLAI